MVKMKDKINFWLITTAFLIILVISVFVGLKTSFVTFDAEKQPHPDAVRILTD